MTLDRPFLGILLMIGFCVLAPLGDATAKFLGASYTLGTLVLVRFGMQTLTMVPLALHSEGGLRLPPRVWKLCAWRAVLHIAGLWLMFASFRFLPLADAVAIAFVMPFIMLLLGRYVLDEVVGARRLAACVVGFLGTLMVIQPSFASVGAAALLPLGVAVVFALFMLVTRQVVKAADPITLQAASGIVAMIVLVAIALIGPPLGWADAAPVLPVGSDWVWFAILGAIGTIAHLFMTWSLRFAPLATVAPVQYVEIPFATFVGWIVFSDFPNGLALAGIAVTMAAGLYILMRERRLSLSPAMPAPQPPAPGVAE
ncbi:MAG: EamA family transporter [Rhodobacteraceae bacterium]|nr:EamA family transporter [Paracoccaceae bacterium]